MIRLPEGANIPFFGASLTLIFNRCGSQELNVDNLVRYCG